MSTFNIRKMFRNFAVTLGIMVAAFCAFSLNETGAKADEMVSTNLAEILNSNQLNFNVYLPKNAELANGSNAPGNFEACSDDYWNKNCNIRDAINEKAFNFFVMVPYTESVGNVQQWTSSITYFQYAVTKSQYTPFYNDSDSTHLDSTLYPLSIKGANWIKMTDAGTGGMNVAYNSMFGAIDSEGEYYIHIRYRQEASDEVAISSGTFGYYTRMTNLNATTITRDVTGATNSAYDLIASFEAAATNAPKLERIAWAEGTKTVDDFTTIFTDAFGVESEFLYKEGAYANYLPSGNTSRFNINKNVTFTFYIQDRAGNRTVVTHTVDNIFAVVEIEVDETLLNQNVTGNSIYVNDETREVVDAAGTGITQYKALQNVTFEAVVEDSSGNKAAKSYISWEISNRSKGASGTPSTLAAEYEYTWNKTNNVYGTWTVVAKAGSLKIGEKVLTVVPVLVVTPTVDAPEYEYGTDPTRGYSYSGWAIASSGNSVDTDAILVNKADTYDWKTMKNVDNGKTHTYSATGFTSQYDEYVFDYQSVGFKIKQRPLTVTYKGGSKTYDKAAYNPNARTSSDVLDKYTVVGLVYGETLATAVTSYNDDDIKDVKAGNYSVVSSTLTINSPSVHGTTNVDANDANLANYSITQNAGTYIIYPIKVHAIFTHEAVEYKQAAFVSSTFTTPTNYTITYKDNDGMVTSMPSGESIGSFTYKIGFGDPKVYHDGYEPIDVDTYKVYATSIVSITGGKVTNYTLTSEDGDFIITKKVLTVEFNDATTPYDGTSYTDRLKDLSKYTFNVTSEQETEWKAVTGASITYEIKFACHANVKGTCNPITTAKAPTASDLKYAGVYTIIPKSVNNVPDSISKNYNLEIKGTEGTFAITRINLSIEYVSTSKIYDGVAVGFSSQSQYKFTGLVSADPQSSITSVSYTINGGDATTTGTVVDVNRYTIAPVDATFTARDSYTIVTPTTAGYYEITKRSASIKYNVVEAVTYNNELYTFSSPSQYTITNFVDGQAPTTINYSIKVGETSFDKVVDAHIYTITPLASSTFGTGFKASNYDVTYTGGLFTINTKNITLEVTTKVMDFKNSKYEFTDPSLYTIGGGMAPGETIVSVAYTVKNVDETEVVEPLLVGKYKIIPESFVVGGQPKGTAGFANYNLTGTTSTIEIITVKIDINTCDATPLTKVYDMTTGLPVGFTMTCSTSTDGVANVTVTPGAGSGYDSKDASDSRTITIMNATLGNNNFEWKDNVATRTYSAKITKRPIDIAKMEAKSNEGFKKEYDATTEANRDVYYLDYSVTEGQTDKGFVHGDADLGLTYDANFASANRCTEINLGAACTLTKNIIVSNASISNENYELIGTGRSDAVGEITKKSATIKVNDITNSVYGTNETENITYTFTGFVNNQNAAAITGLKNDYKNTADGDTHRNADTHTITLSYDYVNYDNYAVTLETGDITVTKKNIKITYTQVGSDEYNAQNKDKEALFKTASHYTVDPASLPYGESLDYVITYKIEYSEKGKNNFSEVSEVYAAGDYRITVLTFKIKGGNAKATNYNLVTTTGIHTVDPITLTITFNSEYSGSTIFYDDNNHEVKAKDYYKTNLLLAEEREAWAESNVTIKYTFKRYIGDVAQDDTFIRNYGRYVITPNGYEGTIPADIYNNYNVANMSVQDNYEAGNFTIKQVAVTVTFNANQKHTYDGFSKDFTDYNATRYTVATMVGDDLSSLKKVAYDVTYPDGKEKIKDAGTYFITPKDVTIDADPVYKDIKQNYIFTYTPNTEYVIDPIAIKMETVTNKFFIIGGSVEKTFDDTTDADNLTIDYIPQVTNEDEIEETKAYIRLSYTWAYNKKNVSEANSIIVSNIQVLDPNYTITPTTLTFENCKINSRTDTKIITLLDGKQVSNTYTYGTEANVTFLYQGFYYEGRVLTSDSTNANFAADQALAEAQVQNLDHEYYPETDTDLRNVGTHPVVGKGATNEYSNYTFEAGNYTKADVIVNPMKLTIKYVLQESIYNSNPVSTDFFTKPQYYTIIGENPFATNNVLPYDESVSEITNYSINSVDKAEVQNVGDYTVAAKAIAITGGNGLATNYTVDAKVDGTTIYKVTKQPITFIFKSITRAYTAEEHVLSSIELYVLTDMAVMPTVDQNRIWGLQTGAPTVRYSVTRKVGGVAKSDNKVINYGVYSVKIEGIDNLASHIEDNYEIKFDDTGTITITQYEVTITFVEAEKIYDSKVVDLSSPTLYTIKVGENTNEPGVVDLIGADKLIDIDYTPTTEIKHAGTYSIVPTGMTVDSDNESDNYIFKAGSAVNYKIEQRELVINDFVVTGNKTKVYDGNTTTVVTIAPNVATSGMDTGLIDGEDPIFTYSIAYADKNALGDGLSVIKVTNAKVDNPDYKISSDSRDLTGATIEKAVLDLSTQNIYSKKFDNTRTMFAKSDVEVKTGITSATNEETLKISWTDITNAFADIKVGEDKEVKIPVENLTIANGNNGGLASNYKFVSMSTALATIEGIVYDISGCSININYKTYDGNVDAMNINFTVTCTAGIAGVDDFVLNYNGATFESIDAKGIKAVNKISVSGFEFADAKYKDDYGFTLSATTRTFDGYINPLTLDISKFTKSADSTFTKVYDGSNLSNVVLTPTGFVGADNVGYSQTATYNDETANPNKTITVNASLSNKNYCFSGSTAAIPTYTASIEFSGAITPKGLTIIVLLDDANDSEDIPTGDLTVEYGTEINVSYNYDGFITGEDENELNLTGLDDTYNPDTMKNVNATGYEVTASGATALNYAITYTPAVLKITRFEVELTPIARTVLYNDADEVDMKTVGVAYNLSRTLPYSETLKGNLTTENNDKFVYSATYKRYVGEYKVLQGTITNTENPNYAITYSSTVVNLTVDDNEKPIINNIVVTDKNNNSYVQGNTATAGLKFQVNASDEAYTLNENAYNLKVTLTICAGDVTSCTTPVVAENQFGEIATRKAAGGINDFTVTDIARNGTYSYIFKVYDSKLNEVATPSKILVRYLAPEFEPIAGPATQQTVKFKITGYESFLSGRSAEWNYFFSRTITDPNEKDFGYHGVPLDGGSSYTTFTTTSGTLNASALTPLGLKGDYRMLLEMKIGSETIYYTQPDAFNIYIAAQAAQAMYLSSPYSLGDGSNYEGSLTSKGNTLAIVNSASSGPSLMAYNNVNGQVVTKLDTNGNVIWSLDIGAYGVFAEKVIDLNEETLILCSAKTIKFAQLGVVRTFDDREVVVIRIDEFGEIKAINCIENDGNNSGVSISVHGDKYAVVIKTESGILVNMYNVENELVWSTTVDGDFDINAISFDNDVVALVGVTYAPEYVINNKKIITAYRNKGDSLLITLKQDGSLNQIRILGSTLEEEFVDVKVYGDYIYVLGNTNASMLYHSYGASMIATGKGGLEGFVALYKKKDIKVYKSTFIGGTGDEIHTSLEVNEHGFTVVGTSTSKEELKVSSLSGNLITLPEYDGRLTLVYEYDHKLILTRISHFQGDGVSIGDVAYDTDGKLMLMSTGSSLSLMIERKFGLEDIEILVKGKKGYVSIVGDHSEIVVTKDGNVISNNGEFIVDSNGNYTVTVTDNYGRMVTKTVEVSSFMNVSGTVKSSSNSIIYTIALIAGFIVLFYTIALVKGRKKEDKKRV